MALVLLLPPIVCAEPPAPAEPAMEVPGGTARLAEALGIRPAIPRSRIALAAIRVLWDAPEGADPARDRRRAVALDYLRTLAAAARATKPGAAGVAGSAAGETVPAFLPPKAWAAVILDGGEFAGSWFTAIVGNRRLALLYHGLAALDPATLAYFEAHPEQLKEIADRWAPLFATFGRSLRVREGRVEVPGGSEAVPLWEAVADERVTEPAAFISRVLGKDGGRLALLYDGLAHLDTGALRFALGLTVPAGVQRVKRFREMYDAAGAALARWKPAERPFERVPYDAVHLLAATTFGADGRAPGPAWPELWKGVFNPLVPLEDADAIEKAALRIETDRRLDAAELVDLLSVGDTVARRERCESWLFATRVFRQAPAQSARDLLVVLKGFGRFQALLPTLERMGISAPATYLAAVKAAVRLPDADRRLWQFQAALSILERARFNRALDAATADALVRSLCAATPEGGDAYRGGVARWLEHDFLAAVAPSALPKEMTAADRPLETRVLAAMAGAVSSPANTVLLALPPVEWEGLKYKFDPAGSAVRHFAEVRARQGGRGLDPVLALARLGESLASAPSVAAAQSAAGGLGAIAEGLRMPAGGANLPSASPGGEPDLDDLVKDTLERARKLKSPPDEKALTRLARPLLEAADWYLADVLGSIAYAPHLGDPAGPPLFGGDPSRRHDFRFFRGAEASGREAWQWPIEARAAGIGWHLSGSLLGLDLALGRLSLRRIPRETIPEAPRLSEAVREAFTETALLTVPFDLTQTAARALAEAIERGRGRLGATGPSSPGFEAAAAEAGVDEWRIGALRWMAFHEPDRRLEMLSLVELARLGDLDAARVAGLDAFGTSAWSRDGPIATSWPGRLPWTTLAGRRGSRGVPALVADLTIGIVQALRPLGLHAPVAAGVLLFATQDYVDTLRTAHEDDWQEMVAHAQAVAGSPIEDYVAGLTITGPLVPDDTEVRHEWQPPSGR